MNCPCTSGKLFSACCEPIVFTHPAPTALELMRSRYTAYTLLKIDYVLETCHPVLRKRQSFEDLASWAKSNEWQKLEIVSTSKGSTEDSEGMVEFKAYFKDENGDNCLHNEKSTFLKENGKWYYSEGEVNPKAQKSTISRNDPCTCGSGKKYKKCCG
jgi:SEC-C motif domain protein